MTGFIEKGAKGMRPMLLAHNACKEWMDYHPAADDPDAYFITKLPDSVRGDVHTPLHRSTVQRRMRDWARSAGIPNPERRAHPHNARHTFVRWAYINREMDLPTIKWMMGHAKDSQTLERTYMNILETDFARKAEEAAGVDSVEEEPEDHLTPEVCPWCDFGPLPEDANACPKCTNLVDPDAAVKRQNLQQQVAELLQHVENAEEGSAAAMISQALLQTPPDDLEG